LVGEVLASTDSRDGALDYRGGAIGVGPGVLSAVIFKKRALVTGRQIANADKSTQSYRLISKLDAGTAWEEGFQLRKDLRSHQWCTVSCSSEDSLSPGGLFHAQTSGNAIFAWNGPTENPTLGARGMSLRTNGGCEVAVRPGR